MRPVTHISPIHRRARKNQPTKAMVQEELKKVETLFAQLGIEPRSDGRWSRMYTHFVLTNAGGLWLKISTGVSGHGISIFGRFDDPSLAAQHPRVYHSNPHSGKWNHHYLTRSSIHNAASDFEMQMRRILS